MGQSRELRERANGSLCQTELGGLVPARVHAGRAHRHRGAKDMDAAFCRLLIFVSDGCDEDPVNNKRVRDVSRWHQSRHCLEAPAILRERRSAVFSSALPLACMELGPIWDRQRVPVGNSLASLSLLWEMRARKRGRPAIRSPLLLGTGGLVQVD